MNHLFTFHSSAHVHVLVFIILILLQFRCDDIQHRFSPIYCIIQNFSSTYCLDFAVLGTWKKEENYDKVKCIFITNVNKDTFCCSFSTTIISHVNWL